MKKTIIFIMVILIVASLVACKSPEEKVAEEILGEIMGEDIDVDLSGDGSEFKLESKDGSFEAGNDLNWPSEYMGDLPELKGKIDSIAKDEETKSATIMVTDVSKQDAQKYFETVQSLGYEGMDMSDDDGMMIMASKVNGDGVTFQYTFSDKVAMVIFARATE